MIEKVCMCDKSFNEALGMVFLKAYNTISFVLEFK